MTTDQTDSQTADFSRTPSESEVVLTLLMGPNDANIRGNVHGGVIMKLCDEAGAMAAMKHARRPTVTVAVDQMSFQAPVNLGNLLTVTARVTWVGRSSIETQVIARAEEVLTGKCTHTNTAYFVYVALNDEGRAMAAPPLVCETDAERQLFAEALDRQAFRLKQRELQRSKNSAE